MVYFEIQDASRCFLMLDYYRRGFYLFNAIYQMNLFPDKCIFEGFAFLVNIDPSKFLLSLLFFSNLLKSVQFGGIQEDNCLTIWFKKHVLYLVFFRPPCHSCLTWHLSHLLLLPPPPPSHFRFQLMKLQLYLWV